MISEYEEFVKDQKSSKCKQERHESYTLFSILLFNIVCIVCDTLIVGTFACSTIFVFLQKRLP